MSEGIPLPLKIISDFWPMANSQPRATQTEVLNWVEQLPSHIKYILLEVPVGGGKSPIALNVSGYFAQSNGDAYILTPQKVLQKQYEDSFDKKYITSLYGKANYKCESKKTNCDIGSDIKPKCDYCPFNNAFLECARSPNVVLNYTLGLMLFKYVAGSEMVRPRKVIVFDEAHTLEGHLTDFNAISFSEFRCKRIGVKFKNQTTMGGAVEWIRETYYPALRRKVAEFADMVQEINDSYQYGSSSPTKEELHIISEYKEYRDHSHAVAEELLHVNIPELSERFVLVNESTTSFKFKELYGKKIFADFVEPMADRFVFMSSTILDKDQFCEDLGLDPEKSAFISMDSEFDVDNRPVFFMPTMRMNYGWDDEKRRPERVKMIDRIAKLCDLHQDESGIIHAGNFNIAKWLVAELENKIPHRILHHNPGANVKRDDILEEYSVDDGIPKLLISPSITEGLDLKDDKGRFAFFCKVPFPNMGDAWIKKRMTISEKWYQRQALIAIIQGGGRVVRSKEDWGHVYILDTSFESLIKRARKMIPKWWMDAYQPMKG